VNTDINKERFMAVTMRAEIATGRETKDTLNAPHPNPSPTRRTALSAGVLLIVGTVAALAAAAVTPALTGTDSLAQFASNPNRVAAGALLYLIAAFASAGIAVALYPALKQWQAGVALGSVIFRTLEAAMYLVAVVALLSVLSVSQQLPHAGAADRAALQAIGDSLKGARQHATLVAVFGFSLGAFLYYSLFYQSRLIPRWLSGWGVAGAILMFAACLSASFSNRDVTGYTLLILPIAVQEMVLAVWLIVKGFGSSAPRPVRASNDAVPTSD
jgi:hypothetical protein